MTTIVTIPLYRLLCQILITHSVTLSVIVTLFRSLIEQKLDNLTAMVTLTHHTPGDRDAAFKSSMPQGGVGQEEEEDSWVIDWSDTEDEDDSKDDDKDGGNGEDAKSDKGGDEQ